jgi:hypothetical protein
MAERRSRRQAQRYALTIAEREGDAGMRHGKAPHHVERVAELDPLVLQKLEACRRGIEEIAHLDARAERRAGRLDRADLPGLHGDAVRAVGAARTAHDGKPRHRTDRRQRLAAEAEEADINEVVACELGSRVALDGEPEIIRSHAGAIVAHRDQRTAAVTQGGIDPPRAGVDGVLHQLLQRRRRAFHHLARGDAVHQRLRQTADRRHGRATLSESRPARRDPIPLTASTAASRSSS